MIIKLYTKPQMLGIPYSSINTRLYHGNRIIFKTARRITVASSNTLSLSEVTFDFERSKTVSQNTFASTQKAGVSCGEKNSMHIFVFVSKAFLLCLPRLG